MWGTVVKTQKYVYNGLKHRKEVNNDETCPYDLSRSRVCS